jgi:sulfatase modifying factor 1
LRTAPKFCSACIAGLLGLLTLNVLAVANEPIGMESIPAGTYSPFYPREDVRNAPRPETPPAKRMSIPIPGFWMDRDLVTRSDFLDFVRKNREWRKSQVKRIFADTAYLKDWTTDLPQMKRPADRKRPVVHVTWFAASAFCHAKGEELPRTDQWEYVAGDLGRHSKETERETLAWYARPNAKSLSSVGLRPANGFGISDLYGLVWEWTLDYNDEMISDDSRGGDTGDLFCGGGSSGARDPSNYAAFMRFSFRNSLKSNYTTANLGFRCAKEIIR